MCGQRGWARVTALLVLLVTGGVTARTAAGDPASAPSGGGTTPPANSAMTTVAPQRGRAIDAERDPGGGPRPHEPVFLDLATTTTEHVRVGLSGWITPSAPFDHHEDPGGVAVGLTITWPPSRHDVTPSGPSAWSGSAAR